MKRSTFTFFLLIFMLYYSASAQNDSLQQEQKMQWWREARFGMFVHWGLYSAAAGEWYGQTFGNGGQEWIQSYAGVPTQDYETELRPLFKPQPGFATHWAKMAKEAGCKYLVFTTKHHEGFALHNSQVSSFDAMDFCQRDLVKEIVEACRKEGLKIGFYHSLIDWHHPHAYVGMGLPSIKGDTNEGREHSEYVDYLHAQVNELMTEYGDVDILWWDYSSEEVQGESWRAKELIASVKKHQPNIIMNNRLYAKVETGGVSGDGFDLKQGDFITPEQKIPSNGIKGVDWETCMTMNGTWGYSRHDHDWKSTQSLIRNLVDVASKGGNYLLNVGPKADGTIPEESINRLKAVGDWMKVYGEAVYGTSANPLKETPWGRCTYKHIDSNKGNLYLHIFEMPSNGIIELTDVQAVKAYHLKDKKSITLSESSGKTKLYLTNIKQVEGVEVIVVQVKK